MRFWHVFVSSSTAYDISTEFGNKRAQNTLHKNTYNLETNVQYRLDTKNKNNDFQVCWNSWQFLAQKKSECTTLV